MCRALRNRLGAIGGFVEFDMTKFSRAVVNLTAGFLLRIRCRRVVGFLELVIEARATSRSGCDAEFPRGQLGRRKELLRHAKVI